jgi:Ca2+-binding EF-hand superfamily protein
MKKLAYAGAAVAALVAIPAMAQIGGERRERMAEPMTRASVQAMVEAKFARIDSNHDGFVTREEAEANAGSGRGGMRDRMEQRRGDMQGPGGGGQGDMQGRGEDRRAGRFDRLDANHDGSISRAEFDAASAARAGHRGEGRGPRGGEAMNDGPSPEGGMPGGDMRDGRGMREGGMREGGMRERGMHLGGMAGGGFGANMFERLDADHDGRVSLAVATSRALAMFDRADANRDGTVTPEERRAAMERMHEARQGRRGG